MAGVTGMKRPFRINDVPTATKAAFIERYKTDSALDIAKDFGTTAQTVLKVLRAEGVEIRPKGFKIRNVGKTQGPELREAIYRLKAQGLSGIEIAAQLQCSTSAVYTLCRFRDQQNPHIAALEEIRDTLRKLHDQQQAAGHVQPGVVAKLKAMEWITAIKLPEFCGHLVDVPEPRS